MRSPAGRHAVVVGGSLAGHSAALSLVRDGWQVTVIERSAGQAQGGTGFSIDLRLLSQVTGVDAGAVPVIDVGFAATTWELLRALLSAEVQQCPGVRVRTGERVVEVRTDEDGAAAS